jgi:hypothetical protein
MRGRLLRPLDIALGTLLLLAAISCVLLEIGDDDVQKWSAAHPFTASLGSGVLLVAFGYLAIDGIIRQREQADERRLWNDGLKPMLDRLFGVALELRDATVSAADDPEPEEASSRFVDAYERFIRVSESIASLLAASRHHVRYVALAADFADNAWRFVHAPVPWQQEQSRVRFETGYRNLVEALESDEIKGPEPKVPLGMAIEIQQQLDQEAARAQPKAGDGGEDPEAS